MDKKVDTNLRCPVCKKQRFWYTGKIVSKKNGTIIVYNKCPHCQSAFLSAITGSQSDYNNNVKRLVSVETLTDCSYEEVSESFHKQPLTVDDVLSVYTNLLK